MVRTRGGHQGTASGRGHQSSDGNQQGGDFVLEDDAFIEFEGVSFVSEEAVNFYKNASNKTISGGKWCNVSEFVHGFESIIENFTALGWSKLLVISNEYYEKLVREFFANMREDDGWLYSMVKGEKISFNAEWINTLLECPNVGSDHFAPTKWSPIIVKNDLKEFFPKLDEVGLGLKNLDMTYFTPSHRLLYHIITNILCPIQGHKNDISHMNLHLFYAIMRKIPINYGVFFIKYLMFCKSNSQHGLCFGRIITRIFHAYEIPLDEKQAVHPTAFDIIDNECFRRMHLLHIANKWMYKKSKIPNYGVDIISHIGEYIYDDIGRVHISTDRHEEENEAGPSTGGAGREEGVMDVLMRLETKFDKLDRKVDRKMAKMNKKINLCSAQMGHIMTKKQMASFKAFMENKEDTDSEENDVEEQEQDV